MSKHTAEPWALVGSTIQAADGQIVLQLNGAVNTLEELKANAALVVAAPGYNAGAREVVPWLDLIRQNYPEMTSLISGLEKLKAAIAKRDL